MNQNTDLVIFDCDGVLVDSEPIAVSVLCDIITTAGHVIDEQMAYDLFLGRSMATISQTIADRFGLDFAGKHLDVTREMMTARFRAELQAIGGIREALEAIPHRRCVASSSRPERIQTSLEITGLLDLLAPHIYSATMVKNGKPAPDLFLYAANQMAVDPARCLVIEDSPAGIRAAKAAGMRVYGFAGGSHAQAGRLHAAFEELKPDLVFDDMRLLPELLRGTVTP
jgi:HAD superfamily hydrolase (TIGR01509 family)